MPSRVSPACSTCVSLASRLPWAAARILPTLGQCKRGGLVTLFQVADAVSEAGLGPDHKLYVNVGAPCNICELPATNGQIRRINLDGSGAEVVARGVRNSVGFDWHPVTKELYFTDNGRDWLSEDLPEDELNRVTRIGQPFGFPYCHQGTFTDRDMGWGRSCDEFEKPVALLGPHAAALGMRFYTGSMFPSAYHNAIFIARHGSWNRTKKIGGDIVVATLNKDGTVKSIAPFLTGCACLKKQDIVLYVSSAVRKVRIGSATGSTPSS